MNWRNIVLVAGLALLVMGTRFLTAQEQAAKGNDREADKLAIDNLIKQQVQAFNNRDAAAIAANWTTTAQYIRNDGDSVVGRDAIQKSYAEFFKTLKGKPKVEVQLDSIQFPSADTAVSQVTLRLKNEHGDEIASSCATPSSSEKMAFGRWPWFMNGIATILWTIV